MNQDEPEDAFLQESAENLKCSSHGWNIRHRTATTGQPELPVPLPDQIRNSSDMPGSIPGGH